MVYMYSFELWNSFRGLYECFPRTLRTPLNTPNTPYTPNTSNKLNRVKHFEQLGLSSSHKEIDFNALECVGSASTSKESNGSKRSGGRMSRMLGIFGMDRMDGMDGIA